MEWVITSELKPPLYSNVEYSEDGIICEGTMDYTDERHCMLAYTSNFGNSFGIGFATDGHNGCDKGLKCDDPKYWRFYDRFQCKQCGHYLPNNYSMRTDGYCYLCDPNITLQELLSDEPILKSPATDGH